MTKRFLWNWSVWIGLVSGIYVFLYVISPLYEYGVMYATFTALPIFFTAGASRKEYFNYAASNVAGVAWALIYLACIGLLAGWGLSDALSQGLSVFVCTVACCAIHFVPLGKTWLNKPAAMFGAISATFSTGGARWGALILTLVLGVTMALICNEGANLLTADGRWKFLCGKQKAGVKDSTLEISEE